MVDYYIDNYSFKGFGIIVQESTGVVDLPKFKPPTEHDWAEYNGTIVDTEKTPRTEARQIQLKCALSAANQTDFLTKVSAFQSVFMTKGLKRLAIVLTHDVGLFYDVYMSDGIQITKRWRDSQMVGQFTVTLTEPEPRKKIIRYDSQDSTPLSISFKNTEAVSVYWGDGEYSQDLYGDVSLSHTYDEPGIYFAIIHGNIEELSEFETNGEELGANNGGAIDIDVPEILNDALTNVELFTTAEPDVSTPLAPYLKFTFNNNSETRILRIAIDYSLSPNIDSVLSETSPNAVRNSAITAGINAKADKNHTHQITDVADLNSTLNNHDTRITNNDTAITTINGKVGSANGIAQLDGTGKVPSSQLPGYVDDVREYASVSAFPATGESGVIYVALDTNKTYRWSGSAYVLIGSDLALGETASTAYRGDRGKTAYDHSQTKGNPHGTAIDNISGLRDALNSIPTDLADLNEDSTHRTVTDAQISQWNNSSFDGLKQVLNLSTYEAEDGEIVQYVGKTTADYTHGFIYKSDVWKVPVGVRYFTYQSYTCTNEIKEPKVIIDNESYIILYGDESGSLYLADNPQVGDKFIYQRVAILTISKIQGGVIYAFVNGVESLVDIVETKSAISVRVFANKANQKLYMFNNSLTKGALIENNDFISYELSNRSEWLTNGYSVNDWRRIDVQPSAEGKADNIPTFSQAATRENLNGSGETTPTLWGKVKKFFTDLKAVAFSGSYNDLSNKPLSVESNKVKYTLSDGTTKLTLAQESGVKDIGITFTSDTVSGNIASGETLAVMMKKIMQILNSTFRNHYSAYTTGNRINETLNNIIRSDGVNNELGSAFFTSAPDAPIANSACMVEWLRGGNLSYKTFVKCFVYTNNSFYIGSFDTGTTPTSISWKLVTNI